MYDEERIVSGDSFEGEDLNEQSLRPQTFDQYIGQKLLKDEISVYIQAAKQREEWPPRFRENNFSDSNC